MGASAQPHLGTTWALGRGPACGHQPPSPHVCLQSQRLVIQEAGDSFQGWFALPALSQQCRHSSESRLPAGPGDKAT